MGRYTGPVARLSRRYGVALHDGVEKVLSRRPFAPGVHGPKQAQARPRTSVYGLQLREKQKAKLMFGVRERQFQNYFEKAMNTEGDTGLSLVRLLETRLDNAVYRLGFAATRRQARQFVTHALFLVNGKPLNVPSYTVRVGDVIALKDTKKKKAMVADMVKRLEAARMPSWLMADAATLSGKVLSMPTADELKQEVFDPKMIVEFYSR
jgi:small subunit ribosomal protein S4